MTSLQENLGAALTVAGGIITAFIAAIPLWLKNKADKKQSAVEQLRGLIEELRKANEELKTRVKNLEDGRDQDRKRIRELERELRITTDKLRDRDELLADYLEHTNAIDLWLEGGGQPPSPTKSWRIKQQLEQVKKEAGG